MKTITKKYGEVSVRWRYDKGDNPVVTKAFLETGTGNNKEIVKEVQIKRRYADVHNKEQARKFSLEKLVKESFSRHADFEDRVKIWEAYKNRVPSKEKTFLDLAQA